MNYSSDAAKDSELKLLQYFCQQYTVQNATWFDYAVNVLSTLN